MFYLCSGFLNGHSCQICSVEKAVIELLLLTTLYHKMLCRLSLPIWFQSIATVLESLDPVGELDGSIECAVSDLYNVDVVWMQQLLLPL